MKKKIKILIVSIIAIFTSMISIQAKQMTYEQLQKEIEKINPEAVEARIIGSYVFTDKNPLTDQDIMMGALSIGGIDSEDYSEELYNKMTINRLLRRIDATSGEYKEWNIVSNLVGETEITKDTTFNIRWIDKVFIQEESKINVSVDVDDSNYVEYAKVLRENLKFETKDFYGKEKLKLEGNKISGLLLKNNDVSLNEEDRKKYENANYFLAYILEVPNASEKTTIKITNLNGETSIKWEEFDVQDGTPGIVVLTPIDKEKWESQKEITIEVDVDGEEKEYESDTYTLDLSGLSFQEESILNVKLSDPSTKDKETLDSWGYNSELNGLHLENGKLTGKFVEQELIKNEAFGENNKEGYYFDFKFILPEDISKENVKISRVKDSDGKTEVKIFGVSEFDEEGNLTILYRFPPETTKCESDCKIYFKVDYDGEGEKYLPTIYTIDYEGVTFEKESKFTITGVSEEDTTDSSWNGWTEEEGYKTEFTVDPEDPHKVKVTGLLPIFNQEDFVEDTDYPKEALYYLAFKLQTELGSNDSEKINVKFFQDDSEETLTKENFNSNEKTLYALKYLNIVAEDGSELSLDKRIFTITLDWDGEGEDYAPYTITVDWSELKFQDYSRGDFSNYEVVNSDEDLEDDTKAKGELKSYGYDYNADSDVQLYMNDSQQDRGPYVDGLEGTIKEQKLNSGFKELQGYYVPIKVYFPGKDIESLKKYSNSWVLILNTEDGSTKEYVPSEEEYKQGWVLVLFKIYDEGKNGSDKTIRYYIDYDGTPKDGKGYEFIPEEYTIEYDKLDFKALNKVSYEYKDKNGEIHSENKVAYEGDNLGSVLPNLEDTKYRTFLGWYETKTSDVKVPEDRILSEHEDIELKAHWNLNVDEFIKAVVDDLNSSDTTYSNSFLGKFNLKQSEESKNEITINIDSPKVPLSELLNTSIPGTIAYILQKGEIKDMTLTFGSQTKSFNSISDDTDKKENSLTEKGSELKQKVIEDAKEAFKTELSGNETSTLDQVEYENKSFSIKLGTTEETVKLVDSEGNDLSEEDKTLKFTFDSDFVVVDEDGVLGAKKIDEAIGNSNNYSTVYIDGNISLGETLTITANTDVTIEPVGSASEINEVSDVETTITASDEEYVVDVQSGEGTVTISDLKLVGGTKAKLKVEDGATVKVDNVDVSGIERSNDEEKENFNAGIIVNGDLIVESLKNDDESYDTPTIRIPKSNIDTATVTINGKKMAENHSYTFVIKQTGASDKITQVMDKTYYLKEENSIVYFIGFRDFDHGDSKYVYQEQKYYHSGDSKETIEEDIKALTEAYKTTHQSGEHEFKGWYDEYYEPGTIPLDAETFDFSNLNPKTVVVYAGYSNKSS